MGEKRNKVIAVIPARYASTRFPGKLLAKLAGRPVIEHVVRRASQAASIDRVLVATDDERIFACVKGFGGQVVMTSLDHPTGTDRIGEVVRDIPCDIVVNVQGDEPAVDPAAIDAAVEPLLFDEKLVMSTLATPIADLDDLLSPHVVKVVTDINDNALYFSRSVLPGSREGVYDVSSGRYKWHIGLYVFRRDFLLSFIGLGRMPLEKAENLEQLRALEHGYPIRVITTPYTGMDINIPQDLVRLERLIADGKLVL
jgi:3-deoxy-manno-octulosonate cytidylyltransferase (CMP-KDO synthetase)